MSQNSHVNDREPDWYSPVELRRDRHAVSTLTREMILQRDHLRCQVCGNGPAISGSDAEVEVQVAYRVLPQEGGNNSFANLYLLCVNCIRSKGWTPVTGIYDGNQWE